MPALKCCYNPLAGVLQEFSPDAAKLTKYLAFWLKSEEIDINIGGIYNYIVTLRVAGATDEALYFARLIRSTLKRMMPSPSSCIAERDSPAKNTPNNTATTGLT